MSATLGPAPQQPSAFRLGANATFHPDDGRLIADGRESRLRPRTARLLATLIGRPGEVLSNEVLIKAVWQDVVVTENSIAQCVSEIRRAMGEFGDARVTALRRRGYVFEGQVTPLEPAALTPHTAPPAGSSPVVARPWPGWAGWASALVLLAAAGLLALSAGPFAPAPRDATPNVKLAVAVLPLITTDVANNGPYAEAFAEYLRGDLARIPGTAVVSRGSTREYLSFSTDAREVGRALGVNYVLEGAVRESGDALTIDLQLVDAQDGTVQWREHSQTTREEFLTSHSRRAARAAQAMRVELVAADPPLVHRGGEAQVLALKAWSHWYRNNPADNEQARTLAEKAVAIDPESALAWRVLAASVLLGRVAAWADDPDAALDNAERAARRALAIDPRQPQVNAIFGAVMAIRGRFDEALAAFDAELALGRYHEPQVYNWIGLTKLLMGEPARAIEPFETAAWLSPRDPRLSYFRRNLALASLHLGDTGRAVALAQDAVRTSPASPRAYETLIAACTLAGQPACAADALNELLRIAPDYSMRTVDKEVSSTYPKYLAARERYVLALRDAGLPAIPGERQARAGR